MDFKKELAGALSKAAGVEAKRALESIGAPASGQADLCSTLSFELAREQKKNPAALALEWARHAKWPVFVKSAQAAGPYLNFYFNEKFWWARHEEEARGRKRAAAKKSGKVLIEFPSVNPNKPWHVGHLRNALLGDSLARLMSAAGFEVERQDYIDDLGLQVAQSVWGRANLPAPAAPEGSNELAGKIDHILGWQYVQVAKQIERPEVNAQVRALLKKLEEGDGSEALEARALVEHCVKAQYETAFAYGIYHDVLIFESDVARTILKEGVRRIEQSGAAVKETEGKNAGCVVVKLEGEKEFAGMENADKVLFRSDGTATYTGKDVSFALWKFGQLENDFAYAPFITQPDGSVAYCTSHAKDAKKMKFGHAGTVVNVIGMAQAYPQKVIAVVMRKMGLHKQAGQYVHIAYEEVVLPGGRFSGREGNWMAGQGKEDDAKAPGFTADELLREAEREAMEKIRAADTGEEEKRKIARAVAVAAVRFSFLRTSAGQKITFDYDKALSLSGDSGPYVQYAYARAVHVLEKGKEAGFAPAEPGSGSGYGFNGQEIALARVILRWPDLLSSCASKCQVHPIADWALELAAKFSQFYSTTQVVKAQEKEASEARLLEVAAFRESLGRAMDILGIERLERM